MAFLCVLGVFIFILFIGVLIYESEENSYPYPVEAFHEGDVVEFVENMDTDQKTIGLRGTVTKRWLSDLGWVHIRVELQNGKAFVFRWANINAITKVKYE